MVLGPAPESTKLFLSKRSGRPSIPTLPLCPKCSILLKSNEIADLVAYLKVAKGPVATDSSEDIPPHHVIDLPGLHAYAQKTAAGEEIEFRVSSSVPHDLSVVKLGAIGEP